MRRIFSLFTTLVLLVAVFFSSNIFAQDSTRTQLKPKYKHQIKWQKGTQQGTKFVDENGDGFNDNAPDTDGDGIPNGRDEDYDGPKVRNGNGSRGFIDEDGDGINDNAMDDDGDGIPNGQDPDYTRPEDGTGRQNKFGSKSMNKNGKGSANRNGSGTFGPGNGTGTGECDGTGPKGNIKRGGGKK
jgi:hypothetical protein